MMECPDFFPLGSGGKHVLIGSLYKTNQWWIGTVAGNPPRFKPESVGIVDYGNGYAAKTGSTWKQTGASRRLVFVSPATVCRPICPRGCLTQTLSATGFHRLAGAHRADRLRSLPHHAPRSVHQHAPQRGTHALCQPGSRGGRAPRSGLAQDGHGQRHVRPDGSGLARLGLAG